MTGGDDEDYADDDRSDTGVVMKGSVAVVLIRMVETPAVTKGTTRMVMLSTAPTVPRVSTVWLGV